MEIIALRTWDSRDYGLIRTGLKITVEDNYGKELIRKGLAKLHIPEEREQAPRTVAHERAPREAPPNPPGADPARPAPAAGSATSSSGRRQGAGQGRQSSSRRADRASQPKT